MNTNTISKNDMLDVLKVLVQEVFGTQAKIIKDPVDDMWIIFNPTNKITYVVTESLEKLYTEFLEEYCGMLLVEHLNAQGADKTELLN